MNKTATNKDLVGAVLVIGGGVAGIQASLDLAESGYKVYLVERNPSIGGAMAQLDKTFPTNDCSMCILSPKLVECARHLNIEVLSYSELEELRGKAGRFTAVIRKKARSIDESLCVGCGNCYENCLSRNAIQIQPEPQIIELAPEVHQKVEEIIQKYINEPGGLIPVLQEINSTFRYLPEDVLFYVAVRLKVPLSQVYHVATFYTAFSLEPRGKHSISVCMGTACHVRGAERILDQLQRRLDVEPGHTTQDGIFTLETVNCLGACALAPVVVIDGTYHGRMTPDRVDPLIDEIYKMEEFAQ